MSKIGVVCLTNSDIVYVCESTPELLELLKVEVEQCNAISAKYEELEDLNPNGMLAHHQLRKWIGEQNFPDNHAKLLPYLETNGEKKTRCGIFEVSAFATFGV